MAEQASAGPVEAPRTAAETHQRSRRRHHHQDQQHDAQKHHGVLLAAPAAGTAAAAALPDPAADPDEFKRHMFQQLKRTGVVASLKVRTASTPAVKTVCRSAFGAVTCVQAGAIC